ncbi:6-phosphofructo-2-kinase [Apiospora arundinis]
MWPQLKIHVDGSGSVFRTAERGVLHIRVSKSDKAQTAASDAVRETSAKLTANFRTHALKTEGADGRPVPHPDAGITAFTASSISTHSMPQYEWVDGRRRDLGVLYCASSDFEVVFRDMALLADAAGELASMPHVSIVSTEWRLTAATRAEIEREARKKAIENAVQKAEDYAGVVNRTVVAVEIQDGPASAASSIKNSWRSFNSAAPGGPVRQLWRGPVRQFGQHDDAATAAAGAIQCADAGANAGTGVAAAADGAITGARSI